MARLATTLEAILRLECQLEIIGDHGKRAARRGKDESACRHPAGSMERDAWMNGYHKEKATMTDAVTHDPVARPAHYMTEAGIEAIDVIENYGLDVSFHLATALKYLLRAGKKSGSSYLQDLQKCNWYLDRHADFDAQIGVTEWPVAVEDVEDEFSIPAVIEAFKLKGAVADAVREILMVGTSADEYSHIEAAHEYVKAAIAGAA